MIQNISVKYDEVEIIFVSNYYDHPLSGVCSYQGKIYWFENEYQEDMMQLRLLNRWERLKKWYFRTLFGICVGWHWHYKNGKRANHFYTRKPKWLFALLFKWYFRKSK